ncbi:MAG: cadherin domain-containing protein [Cyclobacteriaceae bacterium]
MKRNLLILCSIAIVLLSGLLVYNSVRENPKPKARKLPRAERKKARSEYFHNKLKDPKTNKIPENVRAQETAFASRMKPRLKTFANQATDTHDWAELGPADVGGRTRALALDTRNSSIVLAAGVSGGIWKSTDGGTTWTPKLPNGSNLSISFLAQDPVNQDVWYATTGEPGDGGSASGKGEGNFYLGSGLYKSIDNGETWVLMTYVLDSNSFTYLKQSSPNANIVSNLSNSPFRLTSKMVLHDFNGTMAVFICTIYYGIWLSTDGGESFERFGGVLTNFENPLYSDIIVDSNDNITIWLGPTTSGDNGFFRSLDGGATYSNLTPPDYTIIGEDARCILALAPSQQSIVYAFTYDNPGNGEKNRFYIFDYSGFDAGGTATFANRSENLPTFDRSLFGDEEEFTTQPGGYDMALAVHPTNPNFVVLGYVNLIKSEDGFATNPNTDPVKNWIGGNENPYRQDENLAFGKTHHADQHVLFFDPNNPNILWSGHDGGISKTNDITADRVIWESKNNDYNVTQYYTVSIGRDKEETQVIGGTQDNGTPLLDAASFSSELVSSLGDLSSGDGAYCSIGKKVSYVSSQFGNIIIYTNNYFASTTRWMEKDKLFIHPFAVDPNDEGTLFYTSKGTGVLARNNQIDESIDQQNETLIESSWEDFNVNNIIMSAIKVSDQNPSHKLYFGGLLGTSPVLVSWENANTSSDASSMVGMDLPGVSADSWLNDIAINPTDGNEIVLVYSNYNITGLFHSTDGGQTLVAIEGNLGINDDQGVNGFTGPSMRAAEIVVDWLGNEKYYVATSIGLYYTETLDGDNTQWTLETGLMDNVVIEDLDSRPSDNTIVAGTHGRGIFIGQKINLAPVVENQSYELNENPENETTVGEIAFAEPENDDVTFDIVEGNIDGAFTIDTQGNIKVGNSDAIDFETNPIFSLMVSLNDGELTSTAVISISLTDQNDPPVIADQTFAIDENSPVSTEVDMVVATDQDQDALTYSIIDGNSADIFEINQNSGQISIKTANLDHELTSSYNLVIKVADTEFESTADITINVNDINEAPEIIEQAFDVEEQSTNGFSIGIIEASDPENDNLTFTLKEGNTNEAFSLNANTGQLAVNNTEALNFDITPTFSLIVEVSDGEFTQEATITVQLIEFILSVESAFSNSIKTYPNPASDYITVSLSLQHQENLSIELIDMLGKQRLLYQGNSVGEYQKRFDLLSYENGVYILRIKSLDSIIDRKLVIK